MRLFRLRNSLVFPDGVLEAGARVEVLDVERGRAVFQWRGKRRSVFVEELEDVGEAEPVRRHSRW